MKNTYLLQNWLAHGTPEVRQTLSPQLKIQESLW